jgi:hypothetical protein
LYLSYACFVFTWRQFSARLTSASHAFDKLSDQNTPMIATRPPDPGSSLLEWNICTQYNIDKNTAPQIQGRYF